MGNGGANNRPTRTPRNRPNMAKIEFRNVSYTPGLPRQGKPLLEHVSFGVDPGEGLTIMGPSGSGKSTLLRLCNRLIDPTDGKILLDGKPIEGYPVQLLRRRVSLVSQTPIFIQDLSLEKNLLFPINEGREATDPTDGLAPRLLEQVGLAPEILQRRPEDLSVGEAQRFSLARALAAEPEVFLLDEPTSALDPTARSQIEDLVKRLQAAHGWTLLFVTHDLEQARRMGGKGVLIIDGRVVESGTVEDLLERSQYEVTRRFMSGDLEP